MRKYEGFSERYERQLALPEIGVRGQEKLAKARVLLVGVGGLGSVAGFYLAGAGVGTLGLIDGDVLELSNLQRQIAHRTYDLGRAKTESAYRSFSALNPHVKIVIHDGRLTSSHASEIVADYDFVIDATDNFEAKFLIADVCHRLRKPYSHGGVLRFQGQTMTVLPVKSACYRCVFDAPPSENRRMPQGPLGAVPGVIGSIQATEAVKWVVGCGTLLTNRILTYDALTMTCRVVPVKRNEQCPLCGKGDDGLRKKTKRKNR
jgi:molybdopterin/thiamine biosynthesis adenylyltransferase